MKRKGENIKEKFAWLYSVISLKKKKNHLTMQLILGPSALRTLNLGRVVQSSIKLTQG